MKYLITTVAAAIIAGSFAISADAAGTQKKTGMSSHASADKAASCKAEAKKKYSAIHILKRRSFEKKCMGAA
jgi:hypothetical protein